MYCMDNSHIFVSDIQQSRVAFNLSYTYPLRLTVGERWILVQWLSEVILSLLACTHISSALSVLVMFSHESAYIDWIVANAPYSANYNVSYTICLQDTLLKSLSLQVDDELIWLLAGLNLFTSCIHSTSLVVIESSFWSVFTYVD